MSRVRPEDVLPFTVRLDPETTAALDRLAQNDDRTRSSVVRMLIKREAASRGMLAPSLPRLVRKGR